MINNMLKIDEAILESNKIICRQISRLGSSTRGEVSQEILESLRHFVEHILLKAYANGGDIEDTHDNIKAAVKHAKSDPKLKHLSRFHHFLQVATSHRVMKEENAERLMLKFYEFLLRTKNFMRDNYAMSVLENLEQFPLNIDDELIEYYTEISNKIDTYKTPLHNGFRYDRFYVQKIKPFFIDGKIYYEIAFIPANDNASKTDSIIAFTDLEINSNYAVKFAIANDNIQIFDKNMSVRIIVDWEVNIRPCELKNFNRILERTSRDYGQAEQRNINRFLTQTGYSLSEIITFPDESYEFVKNQLVPQRRAIHFFDCLDKCREIIKKNSPGSNILQYLLHHLTNRVLRRQYKELWRLNYQTGSWEYVGPNNNLSNLYLANECIPFDQMPFCSGLRNHVPRLSDLFECLDPTGREHELLAWYIQNNTERKNILFTPLEKDENGNYKLEHFKDIETLVATYNGKLYDSPKQQLRQMIIEYNHLFIKHYKEDTVSIISTIKSMTQNGINNYTNMVNYWMQTTNQVNCDEKKTALLNMFSQSKVSLIYGSAGTGKSYLINHISNLFSTKSRLYLAQTNPAVNNLRRKISASVNSTFLTVSKFTSDHYKGKTSFDIVIIDECSTVNNHDMRKVLEKANFELLVLVGDTYQIESIEFGNWFDAVRFFLPKTSVCELTHPYRTESQALLNIWTDVRKMEGDIYYLLQTYGCSATLNKSIFSPAALHEVILCLNYGGLYGINNINHFLQESNTGKEIWRGIQRYKVGDPILFNDTSDKFFTRTDEQVPVIHNNMTGRIIDFQLLHEGKANEGIQFDIEIDKPLIDMDTNDMDFSIIGNASNGNSIIRFVVNKNKTTDEDDDGSSKAIVPFQIAYAVSIHKAQGLEYDSVKVIITDEIDELITHSIFYTAITRARQSLKIYWTQPVEEKVLSQIKPQDHKKDVSLLKQYIR